MTSFIGKLNLLPVLGSGFLKLFPVIFALILIGKLLNFHGKILGWLGLITEQSTSASKWKDYELDGKKIIYKEKLLVNDFEKRTEKAVLVKYSLQTLKKAPICQIIKETPKTTLRNHFTAIVDYKAEFTNQ